MHSNLKSNFLFWFCDLLLVHDVVNDTHEVSLISFIL